MTNGFSWVPVEAKMPPGNRQVGRHRQLFACARCQQSAIVADAQPQAAAVVFSGAAANLRQQCQFPTPATCATCGGASLTTCGGANFATYVSCTTSRIRSLLFHFFRIAHHHLRWASRLCV